MNFGFEAQNWSPLNFKVYTPRQNPFMAGLLDATVLPSDDDGGTDTDEIYDSDDNCASDGSDNTWLFYYIRICYIYNNLLCDIPAII